MAAATATSRSRARSTGARSCRCVATNAGTSPRFVEQYADLHNTALEAVGHYVNDVRSRAFPATRHTYAIADDELAQFEAKLPAVAR